MHSQTLVSKGILDNYMSCQAPYQLDGRNKRTSTESMKAGEHKTHSGYRFWEAGRGSSKENGDTAHDSQSYVSKVLIQ